MPKPHPREFRDDVVAVARKGEAPIAQIAKDFGISESCLRNWLHRADVEDGVRSGTTEADAKELRDAKRRIRLLEQEKITLENFRLVNIALAEKYGVSQLNIYWLS